MRLLFPSSWIGPSRGSFRAGVPTLTFVSVRRWSAYEPRVEGYEQNQVANAALDLTFAWPGRGVPKRMSDPPP
ncbi:hypothetical protein BRAS3843_2610002 [Bradyrhizobium sp. STM 3843]|nr:hypothetical protein BRAS3843_2610002 [Bradyrhizobium sp. STM 3843]